MCDWVEVLQSWHKHPLLTTPSPSPHSHILHHWMSIQAIPSLPNVPRHTFRPTHCCYVMTEAGVMRESDQCMQIGRKVGGKWASRAPHCPLNGRCQCTLRCMMCLWRVLAPLIALSKPQHLWRVAKVASKNIPLQDILTDIRYITQLSLIPWENSLLDNRLDLDQVIFLSWGVELQLGSVRSAVYVI